MADPKPANGRVPAPKQRDLVTRTLARMILSGEVAPGSRLPTEAELGERMEVSRTALIQTLAAGEEAAPAAEAVAENLERFVGRRLGRRAAA